MKAKVILLLLLGIAMCAPAEARRRGNKQFWPWNTDEVQPVPVVEPEPLPEPQPQPDPTPEPPVVDPTPLPVPSDPLPDPVPAPTPDPEPVPEPVPPPTNDPSIPSSPEELNTYIAQRLGGFARANHSRNGVTVDIYQARGKQRIVWEVAEASDWMSAIGKVLYLKARTGAGHAGLILICNDASHPIPEPQPEPTPAVPVIPAPDEQPLPAPDVNIEPPMTIEPWLKMAKTCGGADLVDAEATCRASGLWLVIVVRYGGQVNRIIYNP